MTPSPPAIAPAVPLGHPRTHSSGADVLRGVAILLVLAFHAAGAYHGYYLPWRGNVRDFGAMPAGQLWWFYPVSFGWMGVALFFVLSGFCIHLSYLRSGPGFAFGRFFWRRWWRIYPAYFVALAVFLWLGHTEIFHHAGAVQLLTHLLFVHNLGHETFFGVNGAFWSVAVEMQLYALFPLLLWGRARFGLGRTLLGALALGCAWRVFVVWRWGLPEHPITPALTLPPLTWFDWMLGAFVAERFHAGRRAFAWPRAWFAVLLTLCAASTFYKPATVWTFSLAAAVSAVVLDAALHVPWRQGGWVAAMEFIGLVSYSIYLWHQPLIGPTMDFLSPRLGLVGAWLAFSAALLAGSYVSYRLLERTGIRVGDMLWQRRASAAPTPTRR